MSIVLEHQRDADPPFVVPWFQTIVLLISCVIIEIELCLFATHPTHWFPNFSIIVMWILNAVLAWYAARDSYYKKLGARRAAAIRASMNYTMNKVIADVYNKHYGKLP